MSSIDSDVAEAMNLAAGLCHSEANRWEKLHKPTADHWRSVAVRLQGAYLASGSQSDLAWMAENGSCVSLDWSEEADTWECSWITSGVRYTGRGGQPSEAVAAVLERGGGRRRATDGTQAGSARTPTSYTAKSGGPAREFSEIGDFL